MNRLEKLFIFAFSIWLICRTLAFLAPLAFWDPDFEKETIHYYQRLLDAKRIGEVTKREEVLRDLAVELGAGTVRWATGAPVRVDEHAIVTTSYDAMSEAELVSNIHFAIQTRSALSAQKLASQSNLIAFLAFLAAAVAAFVAYLAWRSKSRVN